MKKIKYLFFTFFLVLCLTACSIFNNKTTKNTPITIGYVINDKKEYRTYNSYNEIEFIDYETTTGYEFIGWSMDKEIVVTKNDLKGLSEVTLYPLIKPIQYKIIYELDGGKNNLDNPSFYTIEDEVIIKAPDKKYFAFAGWTSDTITTPTTEYVIEKGSYGDLTLTANYINGMVNVIFDWPGIDMQTIEYNTKCTKPDDPIKLGDTFLYWCSDKALQNEFNFDTLITSNITLYPRWENTDFYRLTILNDSYVESNYKNNDLLPEEVNLSFKVDYISEEKGFVGWYINDLLYSKVNEITYKMPDNNLKVEAKFDDITTYNYTKGDSDLYINVSQTNKYLHGSNITTSDYGFTGSYLVIDKDYLYKLDLGLHSFIYNLSELIYVFVKPGNSDVTNIKIDYDINYPYATLIFDENKLLEYSYSLDESEYISCNSYDTFSITNKFVEHSLDIKCGSTITHYVIEAMPIAAKTYLEKTFTYQGNTYDYYIDSEEDLKTLLAYTTQAAYPANGGTSYSFKFYYPYGDNKDYASEQYRKIVNNLMSVPYGLNYTYTYNSKEVDITLRSRGYFNTLVTTQTKKDVTTTQFKQSTRSATYNDFYIENCSKTQTVRSMYELENLDMGVKPIIVDDKARILYEKAKDILRLYVDDSFTVYEKLQAIYDYIGSYVTYDDALLAITTNQSDYQSFTAYSALVNGIAVCDGISSAFKLLCTIEGIECIEVIGCAKNTGHAWNKVKIGNAWYGIDATWSRTTIGTDAYIRHTYFLVDEATLINFGDSHHYEQGTIEDGYVVGLNIDKTANNYLNYYDLMLCGEYDLVINSVTEFNQMTAYFLTNNICFIELKLIGLTHSDVSSIYYDIYYDEDNPNYILLVRK
ncbi:MAG: InlB B-repeat-containing protein [bacterium]|nr:InlB B-repeat-containing protein [bacterium]